MFQENVRLKCLNLAWTGLSLDGGAAVADALMTNQALLELDMSGNRLGLDTAKRMAKVLTSNDSIRVLKVAASNVEPMWQSQNRKIAANLLLFFLVASLTAPFQNT